VEAGLEGLVLKRLDSRYEPGKRSRRWVKVKTSEWKTGHAPARHER
jgi:ATP-dependent DNA ligase